MYMSVDVWRSDGDYDDDLSWPLKADVTIALLNQLEDKNHYSKTIAIDTNHRNYAECPTFIPHSELELNPVKKIQYLKDDTLYFRVTVNVLNNDWLKCTNV